MRTQLGFCALLLSWSGTAHAQQYLYIRVVDSNGFANAQAPGNGGPVEVQVQARLGGDSLDGLALLGFNFKNTGNRAVNLCDRTRFVLAAPITPVDIKNHFDRNAGLTNPPGLPESGFSGTCDGHDGLLQIGGAQNTIGNTGAPVTYPSGTVQQSVGQEYWVTFATGSIEVPPMLWSEFVRLEVDTVFAAGLNAGQVGPVYGITPISPAEIFVEGNLTIREFTTCFQAADVNCDACVNGSDILSVRAPGTWNTTGDPGWVRADVNRDGAVNGSDILSIRAPGTWNTCN